MNNNKEKNVLETLKEILFSSGLPYGRYTKGKLSLTVGSLYYEDFTIMWDCFGKEWTEILVREREEVSIQINTYDHVISEDFISTKVIPVLEDLITAEGLSQNQKKEAKIASLYLEKQRIEGELEKLNSIDGKEVETLICGYCDSKFSKGTGGNYGEYGEVCINCYEGLS